MTTTTEPTEAGFHFDPTTDCPEGEYVTVIAEDAENGIYGASSEERGAARVEASGLAGAALAFRRIPIS